MEPIKGEIVLRLVADVDGIGMVRGIFSGYYAYFSGLGFKAELRFRSGKTSDSPECPFQLDMQYILAITDAPACYVMHDEGHTYGVPVDDIAWKR